MAASDNLNGTQLKLFMTADEFTSGRSYVQGSVDQAGGEALSEMMESKLAQSRRSGVYEGVAERGVEKPVILTPYESTDYNHGGTPGKFVIGNGNHRVATAGALQTERGRPQFVPVLHDDDFMGNSGAARAFGVSRD